MSLEDLERKLTPCERHLNPGHGYYGQSVMIDGQCHIATGRKGEMTDYFENKLPAYDLGTDHKCKCVEWECCAESQENAVKLGAGDETIGHLDASVKLVNIIPEDDTKYIDFQYNGVSSSNISETPPNYVFTEWFKPKESIANGHHEVNLWTHEQTKDGNDHGFKIGLSLDDTNNDGSLSVAIGDGSGDRKVYTTDKTEWNAGTRYHVGVIQNDTSLEVLVDNESVLSTSTVNVAPAQAKYEIASSQSETTPYPLLVECVTFASSVPDDPREMVKQRFNKTPNLPRTKPGITPRIFETTGARIDNSTWYGYGYNQTRMVPGLPGNQHRDPIPFQKYTNRWYTLVTISANTEVGAFWRNIDTNVYAGGMGNGGDFGVYANGPQPCTLITRDGKLIVHTYVYQAHYVNGLVRYGVDYDSRGARSSHASWYQKSWLYGHMIAHGHVQGLEPM